MDGIKLPEQVVFGLDIGTRSIVGTVGFKQNENDFIVVAQSVRFHETRAMLDGQIHDIAKVADTITEVRRELEHKIGRKLQDVCIAAAGRVLRTVTVKTSYDLGEDVVITPEHIRTMELCGVEEAHSKLREMTSAEKTSYYSVGYSVIHYYLGDVMMLNLEGHKGSNIGAEVLATFLPEDVIDGLYSSVERAGLKVANLTLEPIAAINVAIPEKFRLLNLALIDVGAGTSDICITREGSIVAYGMIPCAGDSITESIMQQYLVEFKVAEEMKLALSVKKKSIQYKDILGIKHSVTPAELQGSIAAAITKLTSMIADKIKELNGGKPASAIFIVGGGGKNSKFARMLAERMKLPPERVALRGEEVMLNIHFLDNSISKDPTLVTPIGICLNYYQQNNNFIFVLVNGERVKLYDNGKLTVMDAAMSLGYPNENLFPRRGTALEFTVDGERRMVRGEAGESAIVMINGKQASVTSPVVKNDNIVIKESTVGEDAACRVSRFLNNKSELTFYVNGKKISCPRFVRANGNLVSEYYDIQNNDDIEILDYYTLDQVLEFMDIPREGTFMINNVVSLLQDRVYENFSIDINPPETEYIHLDSRPRAEIGISDGEEGSLPVLSQTAEIKEINVTINGKEVKMNGKSAYSFVDAVDFSHFDTGQQHGSKVIMRINGEEAEFSSAVGEGDEIELYWEE